jgi:hypothetical protein
MPKVNGDPRGFLSSVWKLSPDRERPQPTMIAETIRGRRIFQMTISAGPIPDPEKIFSRRPKAMS